MKEVGTLLEVAGTAVFPTIYVGGGFELVGRGERETAVGGPAVDADGLRGIGEED
jgi:hypothetical protein